MAVASGRLLGVRIGILRQQFAAAVGISTGFTLLYLEWRHTGSDLTGGLLFGFPALLVSMMLIVLMELLARPRSMPPIAAGFSVPHPLHARRDSLRRARRHSQIALIARRWGIGPSASQRQDFVDPQTPARRHATLAGETGVDGP